MTLKGVHIIFITCAVLASIFFGVWALNNSSVAMESGMPAASVGAFVFAAVLTVYGVIFFRKVKP